MKQVKNISDMDENKFSEAHEQLQAQLDTMKKRKCKKIADASVNQSQSFHDEFDSHDETSKSQNKFLDDFDKILDDFETAGM